jgi:hypothetical protein
MAPYLQVLSNVMSSAVVILAFSLLAYTFVYNFRTAVARRFAILLACVMVVYAGDVALTRAASEASAERWLRFQWLGIALMPAAYYSFSLAVLATTNYRIQRRQRVQWLLWVIALVGAFDALFGRQIVDSLLYAPPNSYLEAGPFFGVFALFFTIGALLALGNILKARSRCITPGSRKRINYLLFAFVAPGVGVFPYLIALGRVSPNVQSSLWVPVLSILGNGAVAFLLLLLSYTVAYFGVLTPDRVVRYRLIRFFMRGPFVAILVILAVLTVPTVERWLGLPRDVILFSVITGVIVCSQLVLSVTKSLVDRLIYREDRDEAAWLRELDRRMLTTSDMRQLLENNLAALCELLRVPSGFVAAVVGPDLVLEAVVGPDEARQQITQVGDWSESLGQILRSRNLHQPMAHADFWLWPLVDEEDTDEGVRVLGLLGLHARSATPWLATEEEQVVAAMRGRMAEALADRKLQQTIFAALRTLIPTMERAQQLRNVVPYASSDSAQEQLESLLNPSPIHSPEFEAWVKDALSHYWGGPKLTRSPLIRLRLVGETLAHADDDPTKALRLVLGQAIDRLRPDGKQNLTAPEWLLYNILEMRFIKGRKVREIADQLAISESDLYRKQRVAIGHLAQVLSEMEIENGIEGAQRSDEPVDEPAVQGQIG